MSSACPWSVANNRVGMGLAPFHTVGHGAPMAYALQMQYSTDRKGIVRIIVVS